MRSELVSALGLLAGVMATAAARPDVRARSPQQMRRQNEQDCLEDLEDILDNAPTTSLWPATGCDFTSTLSGTQQASNYASFRSRMASWYSDDLDDISKLERSCTQYASVFSQIRYCYVTGPYPTTAASTSSSSSSSAAAATTTVASSSTTTSTATTSSSTPSSTATPPDPDSGLDSGAKAGLAIGIVLAVLLAMFIGWKFLQRYRSSRLDGAGAASNGAFGAAGAVGAGAGLAAKNLRPPETSVYAFKSELSGDSRLISELDPAAAVAAPRSTGPPYGLAELDPDPPTQLSELPADNYDPTAHSAPPPAYVSPLVGSDHGNTLDSTISPLSPHSSSTERQGLGISNGQEMGQGANGSMEANGASQGPATAQQGWGRGWLQRD